MGSGKIDIGNLFFIKNKQVCLVNYLYETYVDSLYGYGLKLTHDSEVVKDTLHDLFVDLYKYKKQLNKVENFEAYLFRAFKNKLTKAMKRESKVIKMAFDTVDEITERSTVFEEQETFNIEANNNDYKRLSLIMDKLTNKQRDVIEFKFLQGKDYSEIAELMGISIASARTQVYRAIKVLKTNLG